MKRKKLYNTVYCNLFAGPGAGKSTIMAGVFAELKWRGIDCEMVTEYAKDKVWEESFNVVLNCQPYVFGKQLFRCFRLNGKVQIVVTDSPILLSPIYDKEKSPAFLSYVLEQFNKFKNLNIFLKRVKEYNPNGRLQTRLEAIKKDREILSLLNSNQVAYGIIEGKKESVSYIADILQKMINT